MPNPITDAIDEIAEGVDNLTKINFEGLLGITTPLEKSLEAIAKIIEVVRTDMSQPNRNWDDAMNLQIKMDVWRLWRGLFEKANVLDPLPEGWTKMVRGE